MISSVTQTLMQDVGMKPPWEDNELTEEQKSTVEEILANYDPENMTEEDYKTMFDELREAEIKPSKGLRETIEAAGFEMPEPPDGKRPPMGMEEGQNQPPQYIMEFMEEVQAGNVTEEDTQTFLAMLKTKGDDTTGLMVNEDS
jgi:hypothetical protein